MPSKRNPLSPEGRKLLARERGRIARRQGRLGEALSTAARLGNAVLDPNQEREAAFVRGVVRNVEAVLASEKVTVPTKVGPGRMAAHTDFESITVSYPVLPDIREQSAVLRSLMYHEGGHVRFTVPLPILSRMADDANKDENQTWANAAKNSSFHRAWNTLEDQRMETAVTSDSPVKAKYLTALILSQFVADPRSAAANYPLLIWRRYLPRKVRVMARRLFVQAYGERLAIELEEVVTRYVLAITAEDMLQAVGDAVPLLNGLSIGDLDGHQIHKFHRRKDGEPGDLLIPIDPSMIEDEDDEDDENEAGEPIGAPSGSGSESDEDEAGEPVGSSNDEPTKDAEAQDGEPEDSYSDPAPMPSNPAPSSGAGRGEHKDDSSPDVAPEPKPSKPVKDMDREEIADALKDAVKDAEKDRYEDHGTAADERAFNENLGNSDSKLLPYHNGHLDAPEMLNEAGILSATIEQSFHAATMDREPAWVEQQTRGIINPVRYETRQPGDREFFRQWTEDDQPGHNIAVSILLDYSGSMGHHTEALSQAAYAMKLACSNLGIPATVVLWDDNAKVLWDAKEPCGDVLPNISTEGGTDPTTALTDLDNQRLGKERHLVLIMTDGAWTEEWINDADNERRARRSWWAAPTETRHLSGWSQAGRYFLVLGLGMRTEWFASNMKNKGADEAHGIGSLAEVPHYLEQALIDLG